MWSDRTSPDRLRELFGELRSVLPAPSPGATSTHTKLRGGASFEQVAELLRSEPGFASVKPYLLHKPLATMTYADGSCIVSGPGGVVTPAGSGFDILQAALDAWGGPSGAILAGFISYDLASEIEDLGPLPPANFSFPKFYFGLYDSALMFEDEGWSLSGTDAWRPIPLDAAEELIRRAGAKPLPVVAARKTSDALTSAPARAAFEAAVERIVATIHAGDIFQTNLCRCIETRLESGSEWNLFQRMRSISPARYEAFLRIDDQRSVLSISPEMFLKAEGGIVESSPIKGTRARACTPEEDRALSHDLLTSEKDRAELAMIVDVTRNDLSR